MSGPQSSAHQDHTHSQRGPPHILSCPSLLGTQPPHAASMLPSTRTQARRATAPATTMRASIALHQRVAFAHRHCLQKPLTLFSRSQSTASLPPSAPKSRRRFHLHLAKRLGGCMQAHVHFPAAMTSPACRTSIDARPNYATAGGAQVLPTGARAQVLVTGPTRSPPAIGIAVPAQGSPWNARTMQRLMQQAHRR